MNQVPHDGNSHRQTRGRIPKKRYHRPPVDSWPTCKSVDEAIVCSRNYLESRQATDGHWVGLIEGDLLAACEYFLLQDLLGHQPSNRPLVKALAESQLSQGGWARAVNSPFDLELSVTAYMALKAAGVDTNDSMLNRARTAVLAHGGADQAGSITRWRMAILGHVRQDKCFSLPIESLLLPRWVRGSLYSWGGRSRPVLVALAILSAEQPTRIPPTRHCIDELFSHSPDQWTPHSLLKANTTTWLTAQLMHCGRALTRIYQKHPLSFLRERALIRGEQYLLEHIPNRPGWSSHAAWPFWCTLALISRGHCQQSDAVRCCLDELHWLHDRRTDGESNRGPDGDIIELPLTSQVCVTPVRDTAISLRALTVAGCPTHESTARRAIDWLLAKESNEPGDWYETVEADAGGWSATYRDCLFPDVDTTATVLLALREQFASRAPETVVADDSMVAMIRANSLDLARHQIAILDRVAAASRRARRWLLTLQNRDGGWARFDKDHYSRWLDNLRISDELPTSDPSCSEVTGRVLEALGRWEMQRGRSAVDRGVAMLRRSQLPAGHWLTCRHDADVRATSQVLIGFAAIGVSPRDPSVIAATNWLIDQQLNSGAWSPSPASLSPTNRLADAPVSRTRRSTESTLQIPSVTLTAWALLGLRITGTQHRAVIERGMEFLLSAQQDDGTWIDDEYDADDGVGQSRWRRELDSICLPLRALGHWHSR